MDIIISLTVNQQTNLDPWTRFCIRGSLCLPLIWVRFVHYTRKQFQTTRYCSFGFKFAFLKDIKSLGNGLKMFVQMTIEAAGNAFKVVQTAFIKKKWYLNHFQTIYTYCLAERLFVEVMQTTLMETQIERFDQQVLNLQQTGTSRTLLLYEYIKICTETLRHLTVFFSAKPLFANVNNLEITNNILHELQKL